MSDGQQKIAFNFLKSPQYRTIHADGVWGGVSPRGWICMSLFSERSPLPNTIEYSLTEEGKLGEEVVREGKAGIVREIDVTALMDLKLAKALRTWLDDKIAEAERLRMESEV